MADIFDVDNQEQMEEMMDNSSQEPKGIDKIDHQNPYANAPQEDFDVEENLDFDLDDAQIAADIVYPSGVHPSIKAAHADDADDFYAIMAKQNWILEQAAKSEWKPLGIFEEFKKDNEAEAHNMTMFDSAQRGVVDFGPLQEQINTDRNQLEMWGKSSATNPSHYNEVPADLQHWDVVERMGWGYHVGCATKYIWRAGKKASAAMTIEQKEIEDLEKAMVYLQKRIDLIKGDK